MVITGDVNFRGEITFPLQIRDSSGDIHEITAILDTGFEGHLTLPSLLVDALGLPQLGTDEVLLGDGTARQLPIYAATVLWLGEDILVRALLSEGLPLAGQRLTKGCYITHHAVDGGGVMIYRPG